MSSSPPHVPAPPPEATVERALVAAARALSPALGRLLAAGPVRRRLRARALAAWRSEQEPLIVCYGNINRSPFAAALAFARSGRRARSSGLYRERGRPASEQALLTARTYGVELAGHASQLAEPAQLRGAGAVFVFDLENVARIAARAPRALRHTHLLGSLAPSGPVLIEDPHGRGRAALERSFAQIDAALGGL